MSRALVIINGDAERQRVASWAWKLPLGTRIEFKEPKRSIEQNARMWAMLTDIASQASHNGRRYDPSQWKVLFMHACGREVQFIQALDEKTFLPWGQSSSDLSKQEMTDLIEFMFAWGAEHSIRFQDTNEAAGTLPDRQEVPGDSRPASEPSQEAGDDVGTSLHTMLSALRTDDVDPDAPAGQHEDAITPAPERLVSYARDMMAIAGGDGDAGLKKDRLTKAHARWRDDIAKLAPNEQERAKSILISAQLVAKGEAYHNQAVEFFADVLGVEPDMLMGEQ